MGETRDHLETHGGPGRYLCGHTGTFVGVKCDDCPDRDEDAPPLIECTPWEPEQ